MKPFPKASFCTKITEPVEKESCMNPGTWAHVLQQSQKKRIESHSFLLLDNGRLQCPLLKYIHSIFLTGKCCVTLENIVIWNMSLIRNETAIFHRWGFCHIFFLWQAFLREEHCLHSVKVYPFQCTSAVRCIDSCISSSPRVNVFLPEASNLLRVSRKCCAF